jgi:hypothetical protein
MTMAPMSMELHCTHCTALLQDDTTREILEELDRERTRRAELEVQVKDLLAERQVQKDQASRDDVERMTISRKHFMALQTELKGYRDLIDAMTKERPAIAAAVQVNTRQKMMMIPKNSSSTAIPTKTPPMTTSSLPLHVIRLLEIMPWDPRAKQYAFAKEEVYEWQFYSRKEKAWKTELRNSPKVFQKLPMVDSTAGVNAVSEGNSNHSSRPLFLALFHQDFSAPSSSCVLTNHSMTKLYNLQHGYPLPDNGGTWQWVGGWRVEKRLSLHQDISVSSSQQQQPTTNGIRRRVVVDCDEEGWSYAMEASHFVLGDPSKLCWDNDGGTTKGNDGNNKVVIRPVRRRKWTRQRALVEYPHVSEATKCFLRLMAQHMYATLGANKISEQLVDTKMALTNSESVLLQCNDESSKQLRMLAELMKTKKNSQVTNSNDAKAIVVAVNEAAQQIQHCINQALSARNNNSTALP